MPKGHNADGSPKKRPANAGRKAKIGGKKKGPYYFSADIAAVLEKQKSATAYIEELVRNEINKN